MKRTLQKDIDGEDNTVDTIEGSPIMQFQAPDIAAARMMLTSMVPVEGKYFLSFYGSIYPGREPEPMTGFMRRDWRGIHCHWRDARYKHFLQIDGVEHKVKDAIDRQLVRRTKITTKLAPSGRR